MAKGVRLSSLPLKDVIKEYYLQWSGANGDGTCGLSSNPRAQRIDTFLGNTIGEDWHNIYSGDGLGKKLFNKYDEIYEEIKNETPGLFWIKHARVACNKFFEWLDANYDKNMQPILSESNSEKLFDKILNENNKYPSVNKNFLNFVNKLQSYLDNTMPGMGLEIVEHEMQAGGAHIVIEQRDEDNDRPIDGIGSWCDDEDAKEFYKDLY